SRTVGEWRPVRAGAPVPQHRPAACCGTGSRSDRLRALNTPAARWPQTRDEGERRPLAWRRASPFFCSDLLEHRLVQFCFRQQLLQLGVLILERLQPLGVRHLEATLLSLPLVESRTADPVLAANIGRLGPSFLLAQHPDDLLFREPARLHVHPLTGDGLYPFLEEISGLSSEGTFTINQYTGAHQISLTFQQ